MRQSRMKSVGADEKEEKQRDFSVVMGFVLFSFVVCSLLLVLFACLITLICFFLWEAWQR